MQAYGIGGTAQINQLPYYDEYARHLSPKLVVLVFYLNAFSNNSAARRSLRLGTDPARIPYMFAQTDEHGALKLRHPDPEYQSFMLPKQPIPIAWHVGAWNRLVKVSYFAKWLDVKGLKVDGGGRSLIEARAAIIAARPCCSKLLDGWQPVVWISLFTQFTEEHLPPILEEALEYTEFGVGQFKRRTDRDGARLAILSATDVMGTRGDLQFDRLIAIAERTAFP